MVRPVLLYIYIKIEDTKKADHILKIARLQDSVGKYDAAWIKDDVKVVT